MKLSCDLSIAANYKSQSQISRVLSEHWFGINAYCLACSNDQLERMPANNKATDFFCPTCETGYELKTFKKRPARRLNDGAYNTMLEMVNSNHPPALMMLERTADWKITGLTALHPLFLTPEIIERRKPLAPTARRAGWVGCNILLDSLAPDANIPVINNSVVAKRRDVREHFQRFERLKTIKPSARGWTTLTLHVLRSLGKKTFSLREMYEQEAVFATAYPENHNVRAKIRQQLQILRDMDLIEFHGDGMYSTLE